MPFALSFIGLILVITGFQNTYKEFGSQLQKDFSGQDSFIWWMVSIGVIGSLGYVKDLETFSRAFMVLMILVMIIANDKNGNNFFSKLTSGLQSGSTTAVNPIGASLPGGSGGSTGGGGGLLGPLESAGASAIISDVLPFAFAAF